MAPIAPFPSPAKFGIPLCRRPTLAATPISSSMAAGLARFGIPEGQFTQMLVRVEPYSEAYARDRAAAIKEQLAKQDKGIAVTIYQDPDEHWGRPFIAGITLVLQILAVVSLLTSVIIVANTMTAIITQQTDQIGVIKAIGGTSNIIIKVYLASVLIYGFLALAISLPTGVIAAYAGQQMVSGHLQYRLRHLPILNRGRCFADFGSDSSPFTGRVMAGSQRRSYLRA